MCNPLILVVCVRVRVHVTNCYSNTGGHSQEWCYMYVHMLYASTSSNYYIHDTQSTSVPLSLSSLKQISQISVSVICNVSRLNTASS